MTLRELVEQDVSLRRAGKEWTGCCPFHVEKTPSFSVNEDKGLYFCFGCGAKGDLVTYLVEKRGHSMREALRLAGKERPPHDRAQDARKRQAREEILHRFYTWRHAKRRQLTILGEELFFAEMAYRSICRAPEVWTADEQTSWILYLGDLYLALDRVREETDALMDDRMAWERWKEETYGVVH